MVRRVEDYGKYAESNSGAPDPLGPPERGRFSLKVRSEKVSLSPFIYLFWAFVFVCLVSALYCLDLLLCRSDFDMGLNTDRRVLYGGPHDFVHLDLRRSM